MHSLLHDLEVQLGKYYEKHGKHYADIKKRSKLLTHHTHANKERDRNHIDYIVPLFDEQRQKEYSNFIAWECLFQRIWIDSSNNYDDWRTALRMSIVMEKPLHYLENLCEWSESRRDKVALVEILELLIPCILHLENRAGEKIITTIIRKGLDLYALGPKEEYLLSLERTFQTKVFGSEVSPSQWKLRYSKETNGSSNFVIESLQVQNNAARACIKYQ